MQHAREDYNRIQDPAGLIPADEPVFLLRAQDQNAPETVMHWVTLMLHTGGDQAMAKIALRHARVMREWQTQHGKKSPDLAPTVVSPPQPSEQGPAETLDIRNKALADAVNALEEIVSGMRTRAINNTHVKSQTLEMFAAEVLAQVELLRAINRND